MICQKCGAQIDAGMKFCSVCGSPVAAAPTTAPVNSVPTSAPVNSVPTSAPVNSVPTSAPVNSVPTSAPVNSVPTSAPVNSVPTAAPVNGGTNSAVNDLMKTYYNAAQGAQQGANPQTSGNAFYQGAPASPVMNAANAVPESYTAVPQKPAKPRSKSKLRKFLPAACIVGGVAALAGTGLIVYNCNKAFFTHSALGDAGYAHAMVMGTLSSGTTGELVEKSAELVTNALEAQSAMNEAVYNDYMYDDYDTYRRNYTGLTAGYSAALVRELLGTSGIEVTMSADVQISDDGKDFIGDMTGHSVDVDKLLKAVSDLKVIAAEKYDNDTIEGAMSLYIGSDNIVSGQVRYEKDGTCTMVFPGISDIGFTQDMPEIEWEEVSRNTPSFDYKGLVKKISDGTRKLFDNYDYKYTNGSTTIRGVDFNGMTVQIELGYDDLFELYSTVVEIIADDSDFIEYIADVSGMSEEDIQRSLSNTLESIEYSRNYYATEYSNYSVEIEMYVNNNNTPAGVSVKVNDYNTTEIVLIGNGKDMVFSVKNDGLEYVKFKADGKSSSEGTAKLTISSGYSSQSFSVDYKNFGVMKAFGMPCIKGDFEMDLGSLIPNADSTVRGTKILLSLAPNGKGVKVSAGVSNEDYGKAVFNIAIGEAGSVAPVPGSNYKLYDMNDSSAMAQLGEDFTDHISELSDRNEIIGDLFGNTMTGVIQDSKVTSADTAASQIKTQTTTFLTKMDSAKMTLRDGTGHVFAYISDGNWNIYSTAGYFNGDKATWCGGYDEDYDFALFMQDVLRDLKNGTVDITLRDNYVVGVAFVPDKLYQYSLPTEDDWDYGSFSFGKESGVTSDGTIIGTCPKLVNGGNDYYYW